MNQKKFCSSIWLENGAGGDKGWGNDGGKRLEIWGKVDRSWVKKGLVSHSKGKEELRKQVMLWWIAVAAV